VGRDDDFGALLRTFRSRLRPDAAGIRPAPPAVRRVPGLRRDELARLSGVSTEHLTRLEQGRRHPSPSTVDALAGALRLSHDEHERLRLLAGFAAPQPGSRPSAGVPHEITEPARRMLERLPEVPACVCDAAWTVLAGNRAWRAFGCRAASGDVGRHGRNMAWRLFTGAPTNVLRSPEHLAGVKAAAVADLRLALRRYPTDTALHELVASLRATSPEFADRWDRADTAEYHPDQLIVEDPELGPIRLDKDVLRIEPGDLRVVVFTVPADPPDRQEAFSPPVPCRTGPARSHHPPPPRR
jgi:transcriptional regulator with XRE-family HTH domain